MTEKDWINCTDPSAMLRHLGENASDRKLWLFAVACCRRIPSLFAEEKDAIRLAEEYIDGRIREPELERAAGHCGDHAVQSLCEELLSIADFYVGERVEGVVVRATDRRWYEESLQPNGDADRVRREEQAVQCQLLREVFGSPFIPLPTIPEAVRTSAVLNVALATYDERAFDRLPILADSLEDAGLTDPEILGHLRGPGPHCRGCFALDLVLGKS